MAFAKPFFILCTMKEDKEYKKEKRKESAKRKALERQADEMLRKDEESQKLREQGSKIDVNKFKKLL